MKKKYLGFLIAIVAMAISSQAQINVGSLGFNYSALVRDTAGRVQPLKVVKLRFTLLLGQNGTTVNAPWIETQNTTTDAYGFVNVIIGNGTQAGGTAGSFAFVDFTVANYWILIEVFNLFTSVYEPLAKQALQSVPYAKVAGALVGGQIIPSGTIVAFGGDTGKVPDGWLLCDGTELDNTDPRYQSLFNAIGYNWGTTNNANKFSLPYTQGYFLRGASNGTNVDPDAAIRTANVGGNGGDKVGSNQQDEFKSHTHYTTNTSSLEATAGPNNDFLNVVALKNLPTTAAGGNESRPKNVYVNFIIKL